MAHFTSLRISLRVAEELLEAFHKPDKPKALKLFLGRRLRTIRSHQAKREHSLEKLKRLIKEIATSKADHGPMLNGVCQCHICKAREFLKELNQ